MKRALALLLVCACSGGPGPTDGGVGGGAAGGSAAGGGSAGGHGGGAAGGTAGGSSAGGGSAGGGAGGGTAGGGGAAGGGSAGGGAGGGNADAGCFHLLYVEPALIPQGYAVEVSAFVDSAASVTSASADLTSLSLVADAGRAHRVQLTVPGSLPAGAHGLSLSAQGCDVTTSDALQVVPAGGPVLTSVNPAFGVGPRDFALTVAGAGLNDPVRAFVALADAGTATGLTGVVLRSASSFTATLSGASAPGTYDLIAVSGADAGFGLLRGAFTVVPVTAAPPTVTGSSPSSIVVATSASVQIAGADFRSPTLALSCRDAAGTPVAGGTALATASSATVISATLNAPAGSAYCLVRVTNPDNGTFFDYSAVGVTNASLNVAGFSAAGNLMAVRRAPATTAARPTPSSRFVYVLGGDNGMPNQPLASTELSVLGPEGALTGFVAGTTLPKALSFAGAVSIGRYVYVVGGFDGNGSLRNVYRAEILPPEEAPALTDYDVRVDPGQGLAAGRYYYRVAAVLPASNTDNPSGETLASDALAVRMPALATGHLQVQLFWNHVNGAESYRVYRSTSPNSAPGTEQQLDLVADTGGSMSFVDDGTLTPAGRSPQSYGSLGNWASMPLLGTARIGAGVVAVPAPGAASGTFYLYAVGGNSGTLTAPVSLSSIELLTVSVQASGAQTVSSSWAPVTNAVPTSRWMSPALLGMNEQNPVIATGHEFLYAAGGVTTDLLTTTSRLVYGAQVQLDGQLGAWASTGSVGAARAAGGWLLANNQMIEFGGFAGSVPVTNADSAVLSSSTTLGNFNALGGGTLTSSRALQGTVVDRPFVFQLGGMSNGTAALQSIERTIW